MDRIDIAQLSDEEKQALVCLFLARLPKNDSRYKQRVNWWTILESRYNRKIATYKNDKDAFDAYFPNNGRVGWTDKPLEKRSRVLKSVFDTYAEFDDTILESAVQDIIKTCIDENRTASFLALRVQKPVQAHSLIDPSTVTFILDGVYTMQSAMRMNKIVFISLGGDANLGEVDWPRGFYAVGHVIREPYEIGYATANRGTPYYKVDLQIDWRCKSPISKDELMAYPDTYDAPYIGLEIHRDPTQAVCQLEDKKAIAIIRAVIDKEPEALDVFKTIFSTEFMERVLGAARVVIPISVDYGQPIKEAMSEIIDSQDESSYLAVAGDHEERVLGGQNIIFYGVPGCGKSHKIKSEYCCTEENMERIVFHPDYSNADFIGQILPVTTPEGHVEYSFIPGPFTRIISDAIHHPTEYFYLVIEEINRGNAPAIFGEVFQLLDRVNGESEYGITNANIAKAIYGNPRKKVKIPSNLYILATMNTADQNVFTLDTAFKRRWRMVNIPNDFASCWYKDNLICDSDITWESFATTINQRITDLQSSGISSEDMRLGAYFVRAEELKDVRSFSEKVLMYLWNDVFKYEHGKLFAEDISSLDELLEGFSSARRFGVFQPDVVFPIFPPVSSDTENQGSEEYSNA